MIFNLFWVKFDSDWTDQRRQCGTLDRVRWYFTFALSKHESWDRRHLPISSWSFSPEDCCSW